VKLRRSPAPHPVVLLLAPAIQLPLILIFFLLLSSTFLLQPGIAVNVPQSPFLLSPQQNPRIISITEPPLSNIFFDNEKMDLPKLRQRLKDVRGHTRTVIIKADQHALYENIAAVMNTALELGFSVVLATSEENNQP